MSLRVLATSSSQTLVVLAVLLQGGPRLRSLARSHGHVFIPIHVVGCVRMDRAQIQEQAEQTRAIREQGALNHELYQPYSFFAARVRCGSICLSCDSVYDVKAGLLGRGEREERLR